MEYKPIFDIPEFYKSLFHKIYDEQVFTRKIRSHQIELDYHWKIGPNRLALEISYESLLPFIIRTDHNIPSLSAEGLFLTTIIHHFGKDRTARLKKVYDIIAILKKHPLDWDLIANTAQKWDVNNIVLLGIGVCKAFYKFETTKRIENDLNNKKIQELINAFCSEMLNPRLKFSTISSILYQINLRESWLVKLKIALYNLRIWVAPTLLDLEGRSSNNIYFLALKKQKRLFSKYFPL